MQATSGERDPASAIHAINPLSAEISFGKTITKFEETTKVGLQDPWDPGHVRYTRRDGYRQSDKPLRFSVEPA